MKSLTIAAIVLLAAPEASARVWTVGPHDADFPLIGPAIAASAPYDEIRIRKAVYREDLVVTHPLLIVAEEGAVLFGTGRGTIVSIAAAGCELRGLTIEGTGTGTTNEMDAAIRITSSGNRVVANRIRRAFYGIVVAGASDNVIERNEIAGLPSEPFGRRGDGIYLYRSPRNRIARNIITGMRDAIYLQYAPGGAVEQNIVEDSRYGLHDMFSDGTRITNNVFRRSSVGANLMNSGRLLLAGNEFSHNRGITAVGLALKDCDRSDVRSNRFVANAKAVQLDGSSNNEFSGNQFIENDIAVRLASSAESNRFSENEFSGNWSDVVESGRGNSTEWTVDGIGNRWSRYDGFDFDGDGVGEAPYSLGRPFEIVESRNPSARLFLQSPAAGALALVARLSPVSGGMVDERPLVSPATRPHPTGLITIALLAAGAGLSTRMAWRRR